MQFKSITFADKEIIEKYLSKDLLTADTSPEFFSSDMCFNSIYTWCKLLNTEYLIEDNTLILKNTVKHQDFYRVYGDNLEAIFQLVESPHFYGAAKPFADRLLELRPDYTAEPLRDYFDYVYEVSDLINLAGKEYHSKKNHFNAFARENPDYEYKAMDVNLALKCAELYPEWVQNHKMKNDEFFECEYDSLLEFLNEFDKFKVHGGVLFDQTQQICAFTISEQITPSTALIHFEKASPNVRGAFPSINRLHLEHTYAELQYVNRADDSGIEGLRKAKESYHPCFMVEKYKCSPKTV